MGSINRRQWLKSASLTAGTAAFFTDRLFSINAVKPYDDTFDALDNGSDEIIRLSSNENPYGPSKFVREKMVSGFDKVCRYPGAELEQLSKKIADKEGVSPDHILLTIGSTEGLKIAALAYLHKGGELVAADPTFEAMINYAEACGAYVHKVPVNKDLGLDLEQMEKRCSNETNLVFVCNPNNPTGTILPADEMRHFCTRMAKRTMVFSDEAYVDYINIPNYPSMTSLVKEGLNVIVSRTFSKVYGIAGLRIGYLIARPDIIKRLDRFRIDRPNILSVVAASNAMDETDFYKYSVSKNKESIQILTKALDKYGMKYTESHANFVFFKTDMNINDFSKKMIDQNIRVGRPFPPLNDWCRISTGKTEEMTKVVSVLNMIYS
ncbi:MAG: histidinol-phosphate aminotransferase family protein [Saprospiraceae bacterium]|nr:histidinol-phosphate aminotransferase family protein [Saprospiraceae bacterium]